MVQVELVLTFEEFCADDGEFAGERGSAFAAIFPQVTPLRSPAAGVEFCCKLCRSSCAIVSVGHPVRLVHVRLRHAGKTNMSLLLLLSPSKT